MVALLKAFESGTPAALRTFISENFAAASLAEAPVGRRVERLSGVVDEQGPLEFHRLLQGAGLEVSFLARSKKSGDWLEIGMSLEPAPSYKIRGLRFEQTEGPAVAREEPKGSDADVAASARVFLKGAADAGDFSGVVLMARNGKPFFLEAYGLADRGLAIPNRTDTRFNLGSINKAFTQVAMAQLAEQGKLSLSDTIRKHLPDSTLPAADRITILQLVTMSSGLGDFFGEKFDATPKDRLRTLADYLPLFAKEPLLFEPGSSRKYSNAGYVVLGLIIEKVTGQSYYDYVRERIFAPAGMKDTDSFELDAVVPNRATGYTREDAAGKPLPAPRANIYSLPARGSSAGGGYSTAEDLLRFDLALRSERLLSPDWTDWFFFDKSKPPAPGRPAPAGAAPRRRSGGFGQAGGTAGVNGVIEIDLDTGYTVVVLCNLDPPSAERASKTIRQWLGLD
jgi:CubicO group peptidase (beta-lactamase class C family)